MEHCFTCSHVGRVVQLTWLLISYDVLNCEQYLVFQCIFSQLRIAFPALPCTGAKVTEGHMVTEGH